MSWDADWYRRIADVGYSDLPRSALRFFPLYPMLGRVLSIPLAGHIDWALLLIANVLALVFGALIHQLALSEGMGRDVAGRAAWLAALAPPAFVLVMGYSEPLALCLAVAFFLALRKARWGWAAAAGYLVGLARPIGLLLAVPAMVEVLRQRGRGPIAAQLAAIAAPVAGTVTFLVWVWVRFGDPWLPVRNQNVPGQRGKTLNPVITVVRALRGLAGWDFGRQSHFITVVIALLLVAAVAFKLPASFGTYTAVVVATALAAEHLGSLERYVYGAFPVIVALAAVADGEWRERALFALSAAALGGYAVAAYVGVYVP